ncbi:unnamed protein product, partial [marine sediment metagenome]
LRGAARGRAGAGRQAAQGAVVPAQGSFTGVAPFGVAPPPPLPQPGVPLPPGSLARCVRGKSSARGALGPP